MNLFRRNRCIWLVSALAMGLGLASGCSGDDEEKKDAQALAETSPADGSSGSGSIQEGSDEAAIPAPREKVAPHPVSPTANAVYPVLLFNGTTEVTFEWTAVPGVDSYYLEIPGVIQYVTSATKYSRRFPIGEYAWRIWSRYPETETTVTEGPASEWRSFVVRQTVFVVVPP